jgi:predicted 3-demethylubiquinone-9 3-methyltransferase (glyoxalase superfamily)
VRRQTAAANFRIARFQPLSPVEQSQRITPFLWFDANAEEAVDFYLTVFKNSRKTNTFVRQTDDPSGKKGTVLTVSFELEGLQFTALNGGPFQKFNEAVSFVIPCDTQNEIDSYWEKLTDGGSEIACGWLRDKFGLCWQVVPTGLPELLKHPNTMQAMMQMKKLVIAELERAAHS